MLQSDKADEASEARRLGGPEAEAMLFYVFLEPRCLRVAFFHAERGGSVAAHFRIGVQRGIGRVVLIPPRPENHARRFDDESRHERATLSAIEVVHNSTRPREKLGASLRKITQSSDFRDFFALLDRRPQKLGGA